MRKWTPFYDLGLNKKSPYIGNPVWEWFFLQTTAHVTNTVHTMKVQYLPGSEIGLSKKLCCSKISNATEPYVWLNIQKQIKNWH